MQSLNKHIFLILSLLALGLSVIFYSTLERGAINATDEQYLRATQQRIRQELAVSAGEIKVIGEKLKQTSQYTFDDLDTTTKYPYFVYRNQPGKETDLLFWADQQFVPPFNQLKSQVYPYLATFPQGHYLVNRYQVRKGADVINVFSLITVYRRYQNETNYLQSGYNSDLFALDPQRIATAKVGTYQNMYDSKPTFLFSVVPPKMDAYRNHSSPISTVILATLGMFFMGIYLIRRTLNLRMHRHYGAGFVILALYLFGLRAVMLYFGVPFLFVETELFNPKFYSASIFAPSLGDLMLNCLIVVVLALYLVNTYYRSRSYYWLLRQPQWVKVSVSLVTVMLSYGVFYYCLQELKKIYENSHFTLDITLSISFPGLKVVCLLISLLIVTVYFLFTQVLTSLFIRLNVAFGRGMIWIALGTALTLVLFWLLNSPLSGVLFLHALYFVMLYGSRFPRTLYAFRYRTSIYLFSAALVGAAMSTYVIYYQEIKRDIASKREFGEQLLTENDAFGEFLINKARTATLQDNEIRQAFSNDTLLARERIQERIRTIHLDKYLDRFTTEITLFDLAGRPLNQQAAPLNLA